MKKNETAVIESKLKWSDYISDCVLINHAVAEATVNIKLPVLLDEINLAMDTLGENEVPVPVHDTEMLNFGKKCIGAIKNVLDLKKHAQLHADKLELEKELENKLSEAIDEWNDVESDFNFENFREELNCSKNNAEVCRIALLYMDEFLKDAGIIPNEHSCDGFVDLAVRYPNMFIMSLAHLTGNFGSNYHLDDLAFYDLTQRCSDLFQELVAADSEEVPMLHEYLMDVAESTAENNYDTELPLDYDNVSAEMHRDTLLSSLLTGLFKIKADEDVSILTMVFNAPREWHLPVTHVDPNEIEFIVDSLLKSRKS